MAALMGSPPGAESAGSVNPRSLPGTSHLLQHTLDSAAGPAVSSRIH